MKSVWYTKKGWIVLIHAVIWIGLFSLPFLLRHDKADTTKDTSSKDILSYIISNAVWISFFYFNALLLIPRLLNKNLYGRYMAGLIVSYGIIVITQAILYHYLYPGKTIQWRPHVIFTFLLYLFFAASSMAYRLIVDKTRADSLAKDRENENLKTELSLLRSQASPHFMFNVLNNMVALARKKSDLLEPSLIKLSSLIRYTVYEADEETVQLDKEIEYLESYIDLQRQRFGNNLIFDIALKEPQQSYAIEPMLLIPFVENAIKHGTGFVENAHIIVDLKVENNTLFFIVKNKYSELTEEVKDKTSGIGLANVQRRLNLLYNKNHVLQIEKKDGWFSVLLTLNLH
ncbi:MAG: histidine kinase [Chitinophagaceae bacterium]|nr:histidine kinase [Chitinophagaceae bacterium]